MRYLLVKNSFPSLTDLLLPVILYAGIISVLFLVQLNVYTKQGVYPLLKITKFEMSSSLVLSSFFAIFIPHSIIDIPEKSTIGESVQQLDKKTLQLITVPRESYVKLTVQTAAIKARYYTTLILGYGIWFISSSLGLLGITSVKMVIAAVGIYSFLHIAPGVGKDRKEIVGSRRFIGFIFLVLSAGIIVLGFSLSIPSL